MNRLPPRLRAALLAGAGIAALAVPAWAAGGATLTQTDDSYYKRAQETLKKVLAQRPNTDRAKNVILFVGDGMGFSTVTTARIFEGQRRGVDGESNVLAFEAFPYLAASKTYSHDGQVSDSAPTAAAFTTGVKAKNDIMSLSQDADVGDCADQKTKKVTTIFELAESIGMSTGVVSTARLTHATPGATYAHIANRDWESDSDIAESVDDAVAEAGVKPDGDEAKAIRAGFDCPDIARQLIEFPYGDGFEVAMGGGRTKFLPESADDPEDEGKMGERADGRDLTQEWVEKGGDGAAYVWNQKQFDGVDAAKVTHLLGLFNRSHMAYEADRAGDEAGEPSLAQMTGKAIDVLARNDEGYVLLVEGGRVDHASHAGNAYRTLTDAAALNEAVKTALAKVDTDETLIVVTGDHSHTLTMSGYPKRGNPILGIVVGVDDEPILGLDGKPYTTIGFSNGPGAFVRPPEDPAGSVPAATKDNVDASAESGEGQKPMPGERPDPSKVDTTDIDYLQQATVPLESETHGGEDLGIYAIGPWAHLFQGTVEENYVFHVMDYATRISERAAQEAGGEPAEKAPAN
ncbi:MAG: alkaline phosphatase [Geminicoccaceae bacterium]|nr:alkaline phosphatase [Geminicoccaceae bacterium]